MTTACAYSRCSGVSQIDGDTWDRQIEAINSCCASQGLTLIHEYRDEAVPGKTGEESRPGFQRMVSDLLSNGCRTVVIESLDRLARQYDVQQQLATYLASKGLTLISANTGEDITAALMGDPMRRALVQIQGIFAELDKNLLVAKLRKARERQKLLTGRSEGRRAYGEDKDRPEEKKILAQMIALHKQGNTPEQIGKFLNAARTPTRYGKLWIGPSISRILKRQTD